MEKVKKIPIIGYVLRILWGLLKFPKHLDTMYQMNKEIKQLETQLQNEKKQLETQLQNEKKQLETHLQNQIKQLEVHLQDQTLQLQQKTDELLKKQIELEQLQQKLIVSVNDLKSWNMDRMNEIHNIKTSLLNLENLDVSNEYVKKLNWLSSATPTIWGDEGRLHISKLAALPGCLLNTNSGEITVGDYTFSGSRVSILAGSHDFNLMGLLRRDVPFTDGYDIEIGKGVWLGSNCTILGPAQIEDDAVIAAGAVVVPGTHVPKGAVFGGIPARRIGESLEVNSNNTYSIAVKSAMLRNEGVLFIEGCTEKQTVLHKDQMITGHYMVDKSTKILTNQNHIKLFYLFEETEFFVFSVQIDKGEEVMYQLEKEEGYIDLDNILVDESSVCTITVKKANEKAKLFIAIMNK